MCEKNIHILFEIFDKELNILSLSDNREEDDEDEDSPLLIDPNEFLNNKASPSESIVLYLLRKLYSLYKNHELKDVDFETSFEVDRARAPAATLTDMQQQQNNKRKISNDNEIDNDSTELKNLDAHRQRALFHNSQMNKASSSSTKYDDLSNSTSTSSFFKNKIEFYNKNDQQQQQKSASLLSQSSSNFNTSSNSNNSNASLCYVCQKRVLLYERLNVMNFFMHSNCFKCAKCNLIIRNGVYNHSRDPLTNKCKYFLNNKYFYHL
jgi:hypothetical protein